LIFFPSLLLECVCMRGFVGLIQCSSCFRFSLSLSLALSFSLQLPNCSMNVSPTIVSVDVDTGLTRETSNNTNASDSTRDKVRPREKREDEEEAKTVRQSTSGRLLLGAAKHAYTSACQSATGNNVLVIVESTDALVDHLCELPRQMAQWGQAYQVADEMFVLVHLSTGPRACMPCGSSTFQTLVEKVKIETFLLPTQETMAKLQAIPAQPRHSQLIIQQIAAKTPSQGHGRMFVSDLSTSLQQREDCAHKCLMIQCPVTKLGKAFVHALQLPDYSGSGEHTLCNLL
jgi:hypothetical protein